MAHQLPTASVCGIPTALLQAEVFDVDLYLCHVETTKQLSFVELSATRLVLRRACMRPSHMAHESWKLRRVLQRRSALVLHR